MKAQTKIIARIVADQRRQAARAAAANKPGPSNQRRRKQPRQRIGVENIEGRIRGISFKTKRFLAQQRHIDVKKMVWLFVNGCTNENNIPSRS